MSEAFDLSGDMELRTARFRLRPLEVADAADLLAHFSDPRVVEFMDIDPLTGSEEAEAIIEWAWRLRSEGSGIRWAIRDEAGDFAGTAGFNALVSKRASRGEIAYDVVRARWRQGVMTEVLPAVLEAGFRTFGLRRIEAFVTPGNRASCALLERHGFTREGVLRDYAFWKGRFWDQLIYARLSE